MFGNWSYKIMIARIYGIFHHKKNSSEQLKSIFILKGRLELFPHLLYFSLTALRFSIAGRHFENICKLKSLSIHMGRRRILYLPFEPW